MDNTAGNRPAGKIAAGSGSETDIIRTLREVAARAYAPWEALVDAADRPAPVSANARWLCSALAHLAESTHRALGGTPARGIAEAAAGLSLLTKVDDEVIDALSFHGGATTSRGVVRTRTDAYLSSTLRSLERAWPVGPEPRCRLAATVGERLRRLAVSRARYGELIELIRQGWTTQVDAVAVFTAPIDAYSTAEVEDVTARVSGLWLSMVAGVGAIAPGTRRFLSGNELAAIQRWGSFIQCADALADYEKDQRDGLINTLVGHHRQLAAKSGVACEPLLTAASRPGGAEMSTLSQSLSDLGELPALLQWINQMLLSRVGDGLTLRRHPAHHAAPGQRRAAGAL